MDIRRISHQAGEAVIGNRTCVKVVKNKIAPLSVRPKFPGYQGNQIQHPKRGLSPDPSSAKLLKKVAPGLPYNVARRSAKAVKPPKQYLRDKPKSHGRNR